MIRRGSLVTGHDPPASLEAGAAHAHPAHRRDHPTCGYGSGGYRASDPGPAHERCHPHDAGHGGRDCGTEAATLNQGNEPGGRRRAPGAPPHVGDREDRSAYAGRGYDDDYRDPHGQERATAPPRGPDGMRRADERIRDDLPPRRHATDGVDSPDVTVHVNESGMLLAGTVPDHWTRDANERRVAQCPGGKDIENRFRLGHGNDR
jgi:hypothetical protein